MSYEIIEKLKKDIEGYKEKPEWAEVGRVIETGDGIVKILGLRNAVSQEVLIIETVHGERPALALSLEEESIGGLVLGDALSVAVGDTVRRTGDILSIPVGDELIGRVVDTQQFDTALLGLGGGDSDPNAEQNVWLSSGGMHLWNPNQEQPATAWESEIDRLMKRQMVELEPGERKKQYDRVQEIVAIELPMIFLVSPSVVVAQRGNVGNFRPALLDHFTLWNAGELYLCKSETEAR